MFREHRIDMTPESRTHGAHMFSGQAMRIEHTQGGQHRSFNMSDNLATQIAIQFSLVRNKASVATLWRRRMKRKKDVEIAGPDQHNAHNFVGHCSFQ